MPRVKRGVPAHAKHKKLLQLAEGHTGARNRLFRPANEGVLRSLSYAFRDRRNRKRDMRRLWIVRINAACRLHGVSYSRFIEALNHGEIGLDRKMLADLAVREPGVFGGIVASLKMRTQQGPAS
jgi:large subunit ribosomal protein L20